MTTKAVVSRQEVIVKSGDRNAIVELWRVVANQCPLDLTTGKNLLLLRGLGQRLIWGLGFSNGPRPDGGEQPRNFNGEEGIVQLSQCANLLVEG